MLCDLGAYLLCAHSHSSERSENRRQRCAFNLHHNNVARPVRVLRFGDLQLFHSAAENLRHFINFSLGDVAREIGHNRMYFRLRGMAPISKVERSEDSTRCDFEDQPASAGRVEPILLQPSPNLRSHPPNEWEKRLE